MLDTIFIGTSGLLANAQALRTVGNNLANVNTPGFKGSSPQFADLFEQGGGGQQQASGSATAHGNGVSGLAGKVNFTAGTDQSTGNPLDVAISGNGFYAIRRDGKILYTRSGDFQFDAKGVLVNSSGDHVLGLNGGGELVDVTLDTVSNSMPKATATVTLNGNLTSTVASPAVDATVSGVTVIDANGGSHSLTLSFHNNTGGDYTVTITDPSTSTTVGTGTIKFGSGFPLAASNAITFSYTPAGIAAFSVKLDFSQSVTSLATATTLSAVSQDGWLPGVRTGQTIDADGTINITYSNGQSTKGPRLALANFATYDDLEQTSGAAFSKKSAAPVQYGYAGTGTLGTLTPGHREGSNVDLAAEFSNLIVMQRGYQAASHVISTANDMIQELFDMKGNH